MSAIYALYNKFVMDEMALKHLNLFLHRINYYIDS